VFAPLANSQSEQCHAKIVGTHAIVKHTVMARDQLGMNQMYSVGVPKELATSDWIAAKTGMGQNERP
jgi:hypothetical protein